MNKLSLKLKDIREISFEEMVEIVKKATLDDLLSLIENYSREIGYRVEFNREVLKNLVYYSIKLSNRPYEMHIKLDIILNSGLHVEVRYVFDSNTKTLEEIFIKSYLPTQSLD